ncbi:hypothetical protein [Asaia astilbis]
MSLRFLTAHFAVSPQIRVEDLPALKEQGITGIISTGRMARRKISQRCRSRRCGREMRSGVCLYPGADGSDP